MKLRSTLTVTLTTAAALAALAGSIVPLHSASAAAATPTVVADRPTLWSVRFDAERLRSGVGRNLFASLDPILTTLSGETSSQPGGRIQSIALYGFAPRKNNGRDVPVLADFTLSTENGGITRRFEAVSRKHNAPIEIVAGCPVIHFDHQGKEVWIGKLSDARVVLATSRKLLEPALAAGASGFAASTPVPPNELLGGNVEIASLLTSNPDLAKSELIKMLPHLDFHVLSDGAQLDLNASAELDSERSARRAARMIDGMVAALSIKDSGGVPWDERLSLKQDGARLGLQLHLEPQEAQTLFDGFVREIQHGIKARADRKAKTSHDDDKNKDDQDGGDDDTE